MSFDKLCHFENWNRFATSSKKCPHCDTFMFIDQWPPNYGDGSSWQSEEGESGYEESGSLKYVCMGCKREIHISFYEKKVGDVHEQREEIFYDEPLTEKGGKLLTKHDMGQEDYYEKHGEYPKEVYA